MAAASFNRGVWLQSTAQLSVKNRHTSLFKHMNASNRDAIVRQNSCLSESTEGELEGKKKQIRVPCDNWEIIHGYLNDTARHLTLNAIRYESKTREVKQQNETVNIGRTKMMLWLQDFDTTASLPLRKAGCGISL